MAVSSNVRNIVRNLVPFLLSLVVDICGGCPCKSLEEIVGQDTITIYKLDGIWPAVTQIF